MKIEIVSHRGANGLAPENTLAAAQLSVELGVDYVEVDVWTSRDHVFYVMHDATVDRTTNGSGHLMGLSSAEIDRLDAGSWFDARFSAARVPRLDDFLDWAKGRTKVFFDVKFAHPWHLIDLIHKTGMVEDCFLWSGSKGWMRICYEMAPELALKANVRNVADVEKAQAELGARIVEVSPAHLSQELIAACRQRNMRVMAYPSHSENNEAVFRELLTWDIDMVNLDQPDLFVKVAGY